MYPLNMRRTCATAGFCIPVSDTAFPKSFFPDKVPKDENTGDIGKHRNYNQRLSQNRSPSYGLSLAVQNSDKELAAFISSPSIALKHTTAPSGLKINGFPAPSSEKTTPSILYSAL